MNNPLRVAFYGDVNNNYFSFMRHLRDLGVDAHLFLYKDQDILEPRWAPRSDTYEWNRWKEYVHRTKCRATWRDLLWGRTKSLRRIFADFDVIFVSGFAAALLVRAGVRIDFYMPYHTGFEILSRVPRKGLRGLVDLYCRHWQKRGVISATTVVLSSGDWQTRLVAEEMGLNIRLYTTIPMVYVENVHFNNNGGDDKQLTPILAALADSDFIVSCHVRHDWVNIDTPYPGENIRSSKRTDVLIKGFAAYLRRCASQKPKLVLLEYGTDVWASKKLIEDLEIESYVVWAPELKRRQIMRMLPHVDVAAGEFMDVAVTCGVVLESLASAKPLLNALSISADQYRKETGAELPPILACSSESEVANILLDLESDPYKRTIIGRSGREWFDKYAGRGLALSFIHDFQEHTARPKYGL